MAKELLKRSQVKVEDTWKVEDMYATVEDWKKALEEVKKLADELDAAGDNRSGIAAEIHAVFCSQRIRQTTFDEAKGTEHRLYQFGFLRLCQ